MVLLNILALDILNPGHVAGWLAIVGISLLLGIIHGITPDEHTWPITFSYAIGSYSTKRGLRAGLIFSAAFTLQRAIASELAYLGLSRIYTFASLNDFVYIFVGALMAIAGFFIVSKKSILHFDLPFFRKHSQGDTKTSEWLNDPRPWMPAVHGFVAGWGFGAFAIILYTVLAPATHSATLAWIPGALFGIGTMLVQMLLGGLFGFISARKGLDQQAIRRVALRTAGNTLIYGGMAFIAAGMLSTAFPALLNKGLATGLHVKSLGHIGLPFILVIICVAVIGIGTMIIQTRRELANKTK